MQTLQRNSGAAGSVRDARRGGRVAVAALWLGAITLLGLGLRVWAIGAKGLWLDEAFSIWMSRHPLPELLDFLFGIMNLVIQAHDRNGLQGLTNRNKRSSDGSHWVPLRRHRQSPSRKLVIVETDDHIVLIVDKSGGSVSGHGYD